MLKKILSLVFCLILLITSLSLVVSAQAVEDNKYKSVTLKNMLTANGIKRGSHIFDDCRVENESLIVNTGKTGNTLVVDESNSVSIYNYLTLAKTGSSAGIYQFGSWNTNNTTVTNGWSVGVKVTYRVKSIGESGYAQIGFGNWHTSDSNITNTWTKTYVTSVGEKIREAGDKVYQFAGSTRIAKNNKGEFRLLFDGVGSEIEILSISYANKDNSIKFGMVRYHIDNELIYAVLCNNENQKTSGFAELGATKDTVDVWYDENGNAISGKFFSGSEFTDIDVYNQPNEASGTRQIANDGINWYSNTVTNSFSGGNGTKSNPYIIKTAAELRYAVANGANDKFYILGNNIFINDSTSKNWMQNRGLKYWLKSGDTKNSFKGNFDGAGYTISGLLIDYENATEEMSLGLFPKADGAVIKNLKLENVYIKAVTEENENNHSFGALIGKAVGEDVTVENVLVKSVYIDAKGTKIPSNQKNIGVGGIVGFSDANVSIKDAMLKDISFIKSFDNTAYKTYSGAIVGYVNTVKTLNVSNVLSFEFNPLDSSLPKINGSVSNVWALGEDVSLNPNYQSLKTATEKDFHGKHSDFVNSLNDSANWLNDKICFMPTLKSFASEQTEQHGDLLEGTCKIGQRCEYCLKVFNNILNPDNHENIICKNGIPYTCDVIGFEGDLYCKDCEAYLGEGQSIDAYGHDYGDWKIVKNATTKQSGLRERTCKRENCNYVDSEEIPKIVDLDNNSNSDISTETDKESNSNTLSGDNEYPSMDENVSQDDFLYESPMTYGDQANVTVYKGADNTLKVILLISISSFILIVGIVLSIIILIKKNIIDLSKFKITLFKKGRVKK